MDDHTREALLWGLVSLLAFLVLLQGYELWRDVRVDWVVKGGVALGVGAATAILTYGIRSRFTPTTPSSDNETS